EPGQRHDNAITSVNSMDRILVVFFTAVLLKEMSRERANRLELFRTWLSSVFSHPILGRRGFGINLFPQILPEELFPITDERDIARITLDIYHRPAGTNARVVIGVAGFDKSDVRQFT